jgi:antitoxin MazE
MQVRLTRWGNSLGLRIPKSLASHFRLSEGARADVRAEGERIAISLPGRYDLDALLVGITPQSMSDAFDWGDEQGREIVD